MKTLYYIRLDIRKKVIAYCIKGIDGRLVGEGVFEANMGKWGMYPLYPFSP